MSKRTRYFIRTDERNDTHQTWEVICDPCDYLEWFDDEGGAAEAHADCKAAPRGGVGMMTDLQAQYAERQRRAMNPTPEEQAARARLVAAWEEVGLAQAIEEAEES